MFTGLKENTLIIYYLQEVCHANSGDGIFYKNTLFDGVIAIYTTHVHKWPKLGTHPENTKKMHNIYTMLD